MLPITWLTKPAPDSVFFDPAIIIVRRPPVHQVRMIRLEVGSSTRTAFYAADRMLVFFIVLVPVVKAHLMHGASFERRPVVLV